MRPYVSILIAGLCLTAGAGAIDARRPWEMERAGRVADAHPPVAALTDPSGWTVSGAAATFVRATDRLLFGDGVSRLSWTAGSARVVLSAPRPLPVPAGSDTLGLWVYGDLFPEKTKGAKPVAVRADFTDTAGRFSVAFPPVRHKEWFLLLAYPDAATRRRLAAGASFVSFTVSGGGSVARTLDFCSFTAFRESPDGAERIPDAPVPFALPATGVMPPSDPSCALEFRPPRDPCVWDDLAIRTKGGDWLRPAIGGGVYPPSVRTDAKVAFRVKGNSLIAEVEAPAGTEEVRFGTADAPADAVRIVFPYYTYRLNGEGNRPALLAWRDGKGPVFLGATLDWTVSRASDVLDCTNACGLAANGGVRYVPKTDGARNPCRERFVWTLTRDPAAAFPTIPNPPSPWKAVTGSRVWRSHPARDRAKDAAFWRRMKTLGLEHLTVTDHETGWRDGEESFTFRTETAAKKGGDRGQYEYARTMIDELGYLYGPYNNFTDYAPVNAFWDEDRVSRLPDGGYRAAWRRCYAPKPPWGAKMCDALAPEIQRKFAFNCAYCDVHTATAPWQRTDYDARVPGAAEFGPVWRAYARILLSQKKAWRGPVYSEGSCQWIYAGLADANYAHDRGYRIAAEPWLVDFDLVRLHPLEVDYGMGHAGMFYGRAKPPADPKAATDRLLAATVAFGHAGFLLRGGDYEALQSYFMVQGVAKRYSLAAVRRIRYVDAEGRAHGTAEALVDGTYLRSQVVVEYDDGTVVAANGHASDDLAVGKGASRVILPPNGYLVRCGDGIACAFSALRDGRRIDYARSDDYRYLNGRGGFVSVPGIGGCDGLLARVREGNDVERVTVHAASRVELPYRAARVVRLDDSGREAAEIAVDATDAATALPETKETAVYRVTLR